MRSASGRVVAAFAAAGLMVSALGGTASGATGAVPKFTLKIVSIGRNGKPATGASIEVVDAQSTSPVMYGSSGKLPAGQYVIGAVVYSPGPSPQVQLSTIMLRPVRIRGNTTVTLDARAGKPLRVSLNVPGAHEVSDGVQISSANFVALSPSVNSDPPGTTFLAPSSVRGLCVGTLSRWQAGPGKVYELAGFVHGRIPVRPTFRFRAGSLARIHLSIRSGAMPSEFLLITNPGSNCSAMDGEPVNGPTTLTEYVSAGDWQTYLHAVRGIEAVEHRYRSGRTYTVALGAAAVGPASSYPMATQRQLVYDASGMFSFPFAVFASQDCCARSLVRLSRAGAVIKVAHVSEWEGHYEFLANLRRAGWYTLGVDSNLWSPDGPEPSGLLSPRVSVTWRFYDDLRQTENMPVTLPAFAPGGLSLTNDAAPGATTPVRMAIFRPDPNSGPGPGPVYRFRMIRLQVSFDDGKTWTSVPLHASRNSWLAKVHDPASGYVSLRATVIDVHGDRTVETIYRAYGIS